MEGDSYGRPAGMSTQQSVKLYVCFPNTFASLTLLLIAHSLRAGDVDSGMVDSMYVVVGAAIRKSREAVGMTQGALGAHLGLSRTSITNIERGRQPILVHQLCRTALVLGIDVTRLLPAAGTGFDDQTANTSEEFESLLSKLSPNLDELVR